ncbi:MAG: GAF domain-containing protein [Chloroflexota bacterium]
MAQTHKLHTAPSSDRTRVVYKNWRESFATPLLLITLVVGFPAVLSSLLSPQNIYVNAVFIVVYLAVGIATFVRFPYTVRMSVFLVTVYVLGVGELFSTGILGDAVFFFLAFVTLTTMMLSPAVGIMSIALTTVTYVIMAILMITGTVNTFNPNAIAASVWDWLSAALTTLLFGGAIIMGSRRLEQEFSDAQSQVDRTLEALQYERNHLEQNVADRTRQLRQINDITRSISAILDPHELLAQAVNLIGVNFDCYHTAVFLLDGSGQWAELKEATGDAGRTLRDNRYRLDATGKNIIAMCIQTRQPRIALDTGDEPVRFDNPILRYTRSEVTLPLILGERVIGALDLQSTRGSAFKVQDLDTLQNLANQVAVSLENARLFGEAQQSLIEMRATQRQYLQHAWSTLASEQELEYQLGDGEINDQTREVQVPLALRDQIIGQIQMATNEDWTPEQRSLIESIATQAALALENARLVEESQATAAREKLANEITAKIWASTSVDAILQTAVRELGRALDATDATIEIKMEDQIL